MINALQEVVWESCLVEPLPDPALQSYARRRQGIPNPAISYFAAVPWMARTVIDLHPEYGLLMHLDQALADLVVLVVSQENSCRFCYAGVRALLWAQGMSLRRIQRMEQDLARADLPPRTMAAVAFARSQSRSGPAGARERIPDQLHMRLIRPLLGRIIKKHRYRGQLTALDSVRSDAYARLVKTFAGSPIGAILGRTLAEMWASPNLTRRCKLLMLAVIARGLGCEVCALEVSEALKKEGLNESAVTQVLTHLDAPELDSTERLLVPFARETIWYEPAAVQRRARILRDRLSGPQLLEAIGVAALANGLCRMGAMVLEQS